MSRERPTVLIIGGHDDSYGKDARSFCDGIRDRHGRGAQDQSHTYSHIRSTDAALIHAVDDAIDRSPTFRSLFDRLSATNLVVYLRREVFDPHRPEDSRAM